MIISASRRTDIPAFYFPWFLKRLKAGFVLVANPHNTERLSRVPLDAGSVDCIVFWTKNAAPMLDKIDELTAMGYPFYVQFTLTPYGQQFEAALLPTSECIEAHLPSVPEHIESHLPSVPERIESHLPPVSERIDTFIELSEKNGGTRVVWRYDPIIIDSAHSSAWHIEQFATMCSRLGPYTERCVISFVDQYKWHDDGLPVTTDEDAHTIATGFSTIAKKHGITLVTCAEEIDLEEHGITHGACINQTLVESAIGCHIQANIDKGQRTYCRCIESIDIGAYNTCPYGCSYCYATTNPRLAREAFRNHDPNAPIITGWPTGSETITDRTSHSLKIDQLPLF